MFSISGEMFKTKQKKKVKLLANKSISNLTYHFENANQNQTTNIITTTNSICSCNKYMCLCVLFPSKSCNKYIQHTINWRKP